MTSSAFSLVSNQDEGFYSARSDGSISPISLSSDSQSHCSEARNFEVADHQLIMLAEAIQPGLFSEQGHMVYMPCTYCTLFYHKGKRVSLSKFAVKHRNHIYINHWVFLRCNQCKDDSLNDSLKMFSCNSKYNSCNLPCPLQNLKKVARAYIKHGKSCSGGSFCHNLTLCLGDYSCCHNIAFGETTLKASTLRLNMKESLSVLPQVEFPARIHIKHECTTDLCVDQNLLEEALQKADCKLTGELIYGTYTRIYKAFSKPNKEALCIKAACLHNYANKAICHSVDTEIFISKLHHEENTPVLFHYGVFRLKDTVFMVSQQTKNGNLAEYLEHVGNLEEEDYRKMVNTLCRGIQFLHSHCIAHRNLNLDNILVGENSTDLKIAGLSSSCIVQPDRLISYPFVSYLYAAPEFFQTRCFDPLKPDIWSLGIITFFLFNRQQLFPNSSISQPRRTPILNWNYSLQSKCFLDSLLTREYKSRPNIKKVMEHQWLHTH